MLRITTTMFALSLSLMGCDVDNDDTSEEANQETSQEASASGIDLNALVNASGCSDVVFTLSAADGATSLVFRWSTDLAEQAVSTGETQLETVDLAVDGTLLLRSGDDVDQLECTDTFDDSQWTDVEWTAVSGAVELAVDSLELEDDYGMPAIGTITVRDALLSADGQDDITIDEISWTAEIGWIEAG